MTLVSNPWYGINSIFEITIKTMASEIFALLKSSLKQALVEKTNLDALVLLNAVKSLIF